ncbi:hypothetical protein RRG08_042944 [Elysia crispata]|uniref:Uncharacterized protein n=1 Tax=Elysia crispata TaxID=231223 RepID=A0AAE1E5C3_9GAST|nr:hypothetical protein RRG08_042944 [Elysia crispata]
MTSGWDGMFEAACGKVGRGRDGVKGRGGNNEVFKLHPGGSSDTPHNPEDTDHRVTRTFSPCNVNHNLSMFPFLSALGGVFQP